MKFKKRVCTGVRGFLFSYLHAEDYKSPFSPKVRGGCSVFLSRLPEQAQAKARDVLISTVLKHLTEKRPVEASRLEFFAQAEAFAVLVNLGFFATAGGEISNRIGAGGSGLVDPPGLNPGSVPIQVR